MAPFPWQGAAEILITILIGFGFGFVLERAGFGNAHKLAAQFYLYDMRVLKVMFTAIVTAMLLVFLSSAVGLLDFSQVWVPPTHLWPAVIGGFILGLGFIVGGYCPGTSLVSMSTLKIDGLMFVVGVAAGLAVFGLAVPGFYEFWTYAGAAGRLTLFDWLGVDAGLIVAAVVIMALVAFAAAEWVEARFRREGHAVPARGPVVFRRAAVAGGLGLALATMLIGQPSAERMIAWNEADLQQRLKTREVFIDPGELLGLMYNNQIPLTVLDVRSEADFNRFHLLDSKHAELEALEGRWPAKLTADTVVVVVSNDEHRAMEGWKRLAVHRNINAYVLAGGINRWLDIYRDGNVGAPGPEIPVRGDGSLRHEFQAALGDRLPAARPPRDAAAAREFTAKVKVLKPVRMEGGGCG
jgi:hypothetical protein